MKEIRLGVFGLWRGMAYVKVIMRMQGVKITSVCDMSEERLEKAKEKCGEETKYYKNFDEFIDSGMDAVLLCNYFHEHAEYAVRAMEKGIHVFSECTSAVTLSDCVRLRETVERTGCKYMIAENYPFTAALLEMERLCSEGTLGDILYAEGEYNHAAPREELERLTPGKYHWRAFLPRSYYVTHTLGPLMYMTKQMPIKVNANAVHSNVLEEYSDFRHNTDAFVMMNCITDKGALFRFTGCAAMASKSGYRVCGEFGGVETGRSLGKSVNLVYHSWKIPEGREQNSTYTPDFGEHTEAVGDAGHSGGDYWVVKNFIDYILDGKEPFFDVYRGCAMSAVAILAWRSCLEDGKTFYIPDFRSKEDRERVKNDNLSPFPKEDGSTDLPSAAGKLFLK